MSSELKEFYEIYYQWLVDGAEEGQPFSRHKGIRQNLKAVLEAVDKPAYDKLLDEIQLDMVKNRIHLTRSFCDTVQEVLTECTEGTTHLNAKRNAWVSAHA